MAEAETDLFIVSLHDGSDVGGKTRAAKPAGASTRCFGINLKEFLRYLSLSFIFRRGQTKTYFAAVAATAAAAIHLFYMQ